MRARERSGDDTLRSALKRSRNQVNGRGGAARVQSTAGIPFAEHGDLAVYAAALCFAHANGSHGGDQVRGEPLYRELSALD